MCYVVMLGKKNGEGKGSESDLRVTGCTGRSREGYPEKVTG